MIKLSKADLLEVISVIEQVGDGGGQCAELVLIDKPFKSIDGDDRAAGAYLAVSGNYELGMYGPIGRDAEFGGYKFSVCRKIIGLSVVDFSKESGAPHSTVRGWDCGRFMPRGVAVKRIKDMMKAKGV